MGEAVDGADAVQQAEALRPDLVLMDINMPNMDGVEATRQIKQRFPETAIVALSFHEDEALAKAMRDAGAAAYVTKHAPAEELIAAIRHAGSSATGAE